MVFVSGRVSEETQHDNPIVPSSLAKQRTGLVDPLLPIVVDDSGMLCHGFSRQIASLYAIYSLLGLWLSAADRQLKPCKRML